MSDPNVFNEEKKEWFSLNKATMTLFLVFLQIGTFSIGGGYAIIPLIHGQVVHAYQWLTLQEYTDIITISQMTHGPLVVNTASFVGIRIGGITGSIAATFGSILPGTLSSIFLYRFFTKHQNIDFVANVLKGLQASSLGLIVSAAATIILLSFFGVSSLDFEQMDGNIVAVILFAASLFVLRKYKINPIMLLLITGVIGLLLYS